MLNIKNISFLLINILLSIACCAQPSNSYEEYYSKHNQALKYSYDEISQTHSYAGNWDFDGDGKKDSLFLIGNGGAHLYFHPKLKLSSTGLIAEFSWLLMDFPVLGTLEEIAMREIPIHPQFVVADFDYDGMPEIYFNFDITFGSIPPKWKKRGVNSRYLIMKYKKGEIVLMNYYGQKKQKI